MTAKPSWNTAAHQAGFLFFFLPPNEKCKKQNCLTPITPPMGAEELAGECGRQRLPGHLSGKIIYDKEAKRPEVS